MIDNDPAHRYSAAAIRSFSAGPAADEGKPGDLNAMARQIAQQYRRDTLSPVMVSGIVRLVEYTRRVLSAFAIGRAYAGPDAVATWHYPVLILLASTLTVILLELADTYQTARLYRPLRTLAVIVPVWVGALALTALAGFFLKISGDFSRFWAGAWFLAALALLAV